MSERRIDLNLSAPDLTSTLARERGGQVSSSGARAQPDTRDESRFAAAMAADEDGGHEGGHEGEGEGELAANDVPRPFALFGAKPLQAPAEVSAGALAPLNEHLDSAVERLMVGDGSSGRQVRMDLRDDVLPGVTVSVEEREGRIQVDFFCHVERSRLRLNAALPDLAETLARRLQRDVLMRVQTDDDEDPCLVQYLALF